MWQKTKNIYHFFMAILANIWFGFPSKKLIVIGVTGTDGKTTTANLIYEILRKAGFTVSMISSVGAVINNKNYDLDFHVTTPSPWQLQNFFKKAADEAVDKNTRYLVLEVTSHALDQYRIWGINFEVAVITNISNEHLDYHRTYENYVKTKARLLEMAKHAIVNKDDESYKILSTKFNPAKAGQKSKITTYGFNKNADLNLKNFPFKTKLLGNFNQYNILAASCAAQKLGVSDSVIKKAIEDFNLPVGRMEVVYKDNFTVMIDFAHTPNAFEQLLYSIKPEVKERLIHVFGSAGERDWQKRPQMGKISSQYADVIILTAEDPRSESVENIIKEIISGIQNSEFRIQNKTLLKIPDRQEAIISAIKMAKEEDLVLITGKGHERSMNFGKGEVPWSEHDVVEKALRVSKTGM